MNESMLLSLSREGGPHRDIKLPLLSLLPNPADRLELTPMVTDAGEDAIGNEQREEKEAEPCRGDAVEGP